MTTFSGAPEEIVTKVTTTFPWTAHDPNNTGHSHESFRDVVQRLSQAQDLFVEMEQ